MTAQTKKGKSIWDREIASRAIWDSFVKLNPRTLMKNPVMFVVEVGAALLTIQLVRNTLNHICIRVSDHDLALVHRLIC